MNDIEARQQVFTKAVIINAAAAKVWEALTVPALMGKWMAETPIDIITDWKVGNSITIKGDWYKTGFVNYGTVLKFEPAIALTYTHLSSLSKLEDKKDNYTILAFTLQHQQNDCLLTFTASRFATEVIYRHIAFYWNVALEMLKKMVTLHKQNEV